MKIRTSAGLATGLLAAALLPASAVAADPVTVNLRIEGPTTTLFEGPVSTGVRDFRFTGDATSHTCDGTASLGGSSAKPVPTRGAVLAEAAETAPFDLEGTWNDQFGPSFTSIAGEDVGFDPATNRFLAEYENGQFASVGACSDDSHNGDDVLFAYADGSETLLQLSGPTQGTPGGSVTLKVTDAATGAAVSGASVGGAASRADGTVSVGPLASKPHVDFKASKAGAIRSNRVRVCVTRHDCATVDSGPPNARVRGIRDGKVFRHGKGPRVLRGVVGAEPAGLRVVRLSLQRKVHGRCQAYNVPRARFVSRRCGDHRSFKVSNEGNFSYLLPHRLTRGRYDLRLIAVDRAGNRDRVRRGRNRVVFTVR
jgi:hypothetical protein